MKKQLIIGVVVVVLSAIGGFAVSFYNIGDIVHEQYYRGAYDVCVMFARHVYFLPPESAYPSCIQNIALAQYQADWYSQESLGWQWPLPTYEGE